MDVRGKKPPVRNYHTASCISDIHSGHHPWVVVVGGVGLTTLSDVWLLDVTNKQWKEVCVVSSLRKDKCVGPNYDKVFETGL